MNLMPEYLDAAFALKIQISPFNVAMLVALGLCIAVVWHWFKRRT